MLMASESEQPSRHWIFAANPWDVSLSPANPGIPEGFIKTALAEKREGRLAISLTKANALRKTTNLNVCRTRRLLVHQEEKEGSLMKLSQNISRSKPRLSSAVVPSEKLKSLEFFTARVRNARQIASLCNCKENCTPILSSYKSANRKRVRKQ
jgi:hypothetical protein